MDISAFRDDAVREIEDYCRRHGITEAAFGRLVMDDGRLVERMRAGQISYRGFKKAERVMAGPPSARTRDTAESAPARQQTAAA